MKTSKWNVGWGTVSQCNMNCAFCYSRIRRNKESDLVLNDWIHFVDNNHDRINTINYGTGENTLDDSWFKLIVHIRSNYPEIRQSLTTNGYLSVMTEHPENKEAFVKSIDEVDVSLDFCNKNKHNSFRGQNGAYDWALKTLDLCNEYNKQATIVFLGCKQTLDQDNIDGLFNIAKTHRAILRMNLYRPTIGINDLSKQFIVDFKTVFETIGYISAKYHVVSIGDALFSPLLTGEQRIDPSGSNSIRILPDGSITPSTYLITKNYTIGNINTYHVLETLENAIVLNHLNNDVIPDECKKCAYASICKGGVYDRRYLWYGTLKKKDPYCPRVFEKKLNPTIKIERDGFVSVHDGYLPTIFFKP
jgi:radical SAM protein with 4Fe4S-binding SPASM domain